MENKTEIPKIIFLDIDGTLLNNEHQLSINSIEGVQRLISQRKIHIVLATGRSPMGAKPIYQKLDLNSPLICLNGSLVTNQPFSEKFLVNNTLDLSSITLLKKLIQHLTISINYFSQYDWYCENRDEWVIREEWILRSNATCVPIKVLLRKWAHTNSGPNKIECIGTPDQIETAHKILINHFGQSLYILKTSANYIEINPPNTDKSIGVQAVLKDLNIPLSTSWAIGDNINDIEMVTMVNRGISMANGHPSLKSKVNHTTQFSNDEEGVIRYFQTSGILDV